MRVISLEWRWNDGVRRPRSGSHTITKGGEAGHPQAGREKLSERWDYLGEGQLRTASIGGGLCPRYGGFGYATWVDTLWIVRISWHMYNLN